MVNIDEIGCDECPKSKLLLNADAPQLVQIYNQQQASNLPAMGDPVKWPAAMRDAWLILEQQKHTDEDAMRRAIHKAMK